MNTKRIYSYQLAKLIISHGIKPIELVPDPNVKFFNNWIFEDTPQLRLIMRDYTRMR